MDGTANEHENITVEGFPSIFLFPAGKGAQPISYDEADRSLKVCARLQQPTSRGLLAAAAGKTLVPHALFPCSTDTCQRREQSSSRQIYASRCACLAPPPMLGSWSTSCMSQLGHHALCWPPAQGLTLFLKERASGKFELPKKQTEEEDAADAEEAAARDSEEQAAECAHPITSQCQAVGCLLL